jgi:hypothetical protein
MKSDYYVYEYVDPRNDQPFYIGKGRGRRIFKHLKETDENTENKFKHAVIKGLWNKGLEPIVRKVHENLTESDAYEKEAELIKQHGRRGIDQNGVLTNIIIDNRPPNGWTGPNAELRRRALIERRTGAKHSDETKEKCRQLHLGKPKSEEHKQKLRDSKDYRGEKNPNFGKTASEETRQKISESRMGQRHSDEVIQKIAQINTGKKRSPETCKNISDALKLKNALRRAEKESQ